MKYQERFSAHPDDVKKYDTHKLREHFLVDTLFDVDEVNLCYSHYDRFIVGGACPSTKPLRLETIPALRSVHFLDRREIGIVNVGSKGTVTVDGEVFELDFKETLYVGKGKKEVVFASSKQTNAAKFYFNSAPAHKEIKKVTLKDAEIVELGSHETCNARRINKLLVHSILPTCQLQMGMTELQVGSVWNTMPAHTHSRRMEAYFYFELPISQSVCHYMGEPSDTRHLWVHNEQAVISPDWSIHSAAGTYNYSFIWGMAGENLDYGDMDIVQPSELL